MLRPEPLIVQSATDSITTSAGLLVLVSEYRTGYTVEVFSEFQTRVELGGVGCTVVTWLEGGVFVIDKLCEDSKCCLITVKGPSYK